MTEVLPVSDAVIAVIRRLDARWVRAAADLGFGVVRSDDAYVSYPGDGCIHIASPSNLDRDDTVAQIVLHELCHWLCEGPASRAQADWGLDNFTDLDIPREHLALRVQLSLNREFGLERALVPTTDFRPYYGQLCAARPETGAAGLGGLHEFTTLGEGRTGGWMPGRRSTDTEGAGSSELRVVLGTIRGALRETAAALRAAGLLDGGRGESHHR